MFDGNSRYAKVPDGTMTIVEPDGTARTIRFKRRRFLPSPSTMTVLVEHTVRDGERLDVVTARYLGDPTQFWRVCDANAVFRPDELTRAPGSVIDIASPAP